MQVRFLKPEEADELDEFVAKHPFGSVEQSWSWGVLQTSIPGRNSFYVLAVVAGKKERIVASMLLVRQHMGFGKHWLWCPRGPLLPEDDASGAWKMLKGAAKALALKDGDVFMRIEPGVPVEENFEPAGKRSKSSYLPEHSLVLNLKVSGESILKQMKQKGRYNIKQAHKTGVYVRRGGPEDIDDFYEILSETAVRDGFHVHERDFYKLMMEELEGQVNLYLAYVDHELLGGILVTHFGKTATYYFGASSNKYRQKMAPYALQWFAIQEAKKAGMERYDFLGVAPEGDDCDRLAGVTQFKTRFGGERLQYHKARVFVYRRPWWWLYRLAKTIRP